MERKDRFLRCWLPLSMMILVMMNPVRSDAARLVSEKNWSKGFVEVAKKVQPSVVSIRSERTVTLSPGQGLGEDFFKGTPFEDFFKQHGGPPAKRKQMGEGSGVIVDGKGYILTNYHVVTEADKITVRLFDGKELKGTVKGTDPKTDLAVVHVEAKDLPVATLGDSDKLQVGEWAIAIGSPWSRRDSNGRRGQCKRPHGPRHGDLRRLHPNRRFHQSGQ
jgi:S1-C subfamily serine protease